MLNRIFIATGLIVSAFAAQAAMPPASDASAQAGSFLQIAADAGHQVVSVVNGDASSSNETESSNVANTSVVSVPEPETYALMLAGLAAVGYVIRRRKG